ncbi:MAG: hypothetical protein AAFY58_07995, partial [Planctomycetota bacterium]
AVPVKRKAPVGSPKGVSFGDEHRLPDLATLDRETPSSERRFADVRMAWSEEGLAFRVEVDEKRKPLWCRDTRLDESDGLHVWIDTRATHTLHRATKFCHRFVFTPAGGGSGATEPLADQVLINRARENARPVRPRELQVASKVTKSGYRLAAFVPASALGGFDPEQQPRIGFNYAVLDRELGMQTFANGASLPFDEDPSCWATLELAR